jgi:UPF0755 protein
MNRKKLVLSIIILLLLLIITAIFFGYDYYRMIYSVNIDLKGKKYEYVYVKTGADFKNVIDSLMKKSKLIDSSSFCWLARKKNYDNHVKPGRYKIKDGMNNNELVNLLRSGKQEPVRLTFNYLRNKEQLASRISKQIEADSFSIIKALSDNEILNKYKFNSRNIISMFIPNTYEMYWNTSSTLFLEKMNDAYQKFWNKERKAKALSIGMNELEITTLASIVQAEQSNHNNEKAIIAGLYINRLRSNMPLQSDPTILYAINDFSRQRLLNRDKEVDSPYNTYKYTGLPPSPILIPEISSIEAVLNFEKNDYIYMCAKDDFSGYHNFSRTLEQHNSNARKYQSALDKKGIKH